MPRLIVLVIHDLLPRGREPTLGSVRGVEFGYRVTRVHGRLLRENRESLRSRARGPVPRRGICAHYRSRLIGFKRLRARLVTLAGGDPGYRPRFLRLAISSV